MARVDVPVTTIVRTGATAPTYVTGDASNHHKIDANNGQIFVEAYNSGASSRTVSFNVYTTVDGLAVADQTVTVAAGVIKFCGPFTNNYTQADGDLYFSTSHADMRFRAWLSAGV